MIPASAHLLDVVSKRVAAGELSIEAAVDELKKAGQWRSLQERRDVEAVLEMAQRSARRMTAEQAQELCDELEQLKGAQ